MGKIIESAKSCKDLPLCWIKETERYKLNDAQGGKNLPIIYISKNTRKVLEQFGAGYRKVKTRKGYMYEFWDKSLYKTEKLTFPTYEFDSGKYKYKGYRTVKNPTKETVEKAYELESKIKEYMRAQKAEVQVYEGEMEEILRDLLEGKPSKYVYSKSFEEDEEYITEYEHFYVFVLKTYIGEPTGHVLIFDKNKIGMVIDIKVPKEHIAYICGREGCNVKKWSQKMGINKIKLKPY